MINLSAGKVHDYLVRLNGKLISRTDSFECSGVVLDERVRWDIHVEKTCKKVGGGIAVMKRTKFVPDDTLQTIYRAMIQAYFDYCSPLWGNCSAYLKEELQRFQNKRQEYIYSMYVFVYSHVLRRNQLHVVTLACVLVK